MDRPQGGAGHAPIHTPHEMSGFPGVIRDTHTGAHIARSAPVMPLRTPRSLLLQLSSAAVVFAALGPLAAGCESGTSVLSNSSWDDGGHEVPADAGQGLDANRNGQPDAGQAHDGGGKIIGDAGDGAAGDGGDGKACR